MTIIDKHFTFIGPNLQPATCRLRVFSSLDQRARARAIHDDDDIATRFVVVIATELRDNPGASITNMASECAAQVCIFHDIHPSRLVWFEHYDDRELPPSQWPHYRPTGESYDLVNFAFLSARQINDIGGVSLGQASWKASSKAAVELMIGEELP